MKRLVALLVVVGAAAGGYWWWNSTKDARTIAELRERLDRLKASEAVADVAVLGQRRGPDGTTYTKLSFVEYQPGTTDPALSKTFEVAGSEFYIDGLVVAFDDKFVEVGDGLRGKSLILFRRAFGDEQKPVDGVSLYNANTNPNDPVPDPLRVAGNDQFQRKLWASFWDLANSPDAAAKQGVRVAEGVAPHMVAKVGQVYQVTVRATGEVDIKPRLSPAVQKAVAGQGAP